MPIEAPRPPDSQEERFARRKQQFQRSVVEQPKRGLFRKASGLAVSDSEPPAFQVDARLPNPAILTCNEPIPLRVLVQKLNDSLASVLLSMIQIELVAQTTIRAHDLSRVEVSSWVLLSVANMNMPLGNPVDKSQKEWKLPSRLWENIALPNTVAPSFDTCNISRTYELEVRVGLTHSVASGVKPELIVLPLRLPVQVFSGIAPPSQLLEAMRNQPPRPQLHSSVSGANNTSHLHVPHMPPIPTTPTSPTWEDHSFPAAAGMHNPAARYGEFPNDAPPSYEDAMAENLAPVDGPRRNYDVSDESGTSNSAFNEKGGALGRRTSERLFSQNAPSGPNRSLSMNPGETLPSDEEVHERVRELDLGETRRPSVPAKTSRKKKG